MSQNYLDMQFGTVFNFLVNNNCWDYLKYDLKRDEMQIIAIIKIFSSFKKDLYSCNDALLDLHQKIVIIKIFSSFKKDLAPFSIS